MLYFKTWLLNGAADMFVQLTVVLQSCETTSLSVLFDPAFRDDRYIRMASDTVTVSYHEHEHVVSYTVGFLFNPLECSVVAVQYCYSVSC